MKETKIAQQGDEIQLHVKLTLENGFVVENSFGSEPLCFVLGDGSLEQGLEAVLVGRKCREHGVVDISPGSVFPLPDESLIQCVPLSDFAEMSKTELKKGVIISFETPSGEHVPGMIVNLEEDQATVDFNHPLSGHRFEFEFEIVSINPQS